MCPLRLDRWFSAIAIFSTFLCALSALDAQEAEALKVTDAAPPDEVRTRDGSVILGEIQSMTGGNVVIKPKFADAVTVKWSEVKSIVSPKQRRYVLKGGSALVGSAATGPDGKLLVTTSDLGLPTAVDFISVEAVDPPTVPDTTFKFNSGVGLSISDGNTRTRTGSLFAEFEARHKVHRINLRGAYNYAQDEDGETVKNGKASIKYDFFATDRLFLYANAFFEYDKFQDLSLRTALSAGPGYQVWNKGDFTSDWLKELSGFVEAGLAYFDEDFRRGKDNAYVSARWSFKADLPLAVLGADRKVALFHFHEGYPGLERGADLYITTEQGVRVNLLSNVIATAQVNWRWDNTPSVDASGDRLRRSDTLYLLTVGVTWDS